MAPVVHEIARVYSAQFVVATVDIDTAERALVDHFQVSSVPLFLFIHNGKVVHVVRGKKEDEVKLTAAIMAKTTHTELLP